MSRPRWPATAGAVPTRSSEKSAGGPTGRAGWSCARVWEDYRGELDAQLRAVNADRGLRDRWEAATSGRSGIACFDAWGEELTQHGYLHNHARMWYASLWVYTLGLPWALGADFFLRHLLDGDPASNTLSWRWVCGLQTRGKTYHASAENIARYTEGRFRPEEAFAPSAEPLEGPEPPRPGRLPARGRPAPGKAGVLLTEEDLHAESWRIGQAEVVAVAALTPSEDRSPLPLGHLARQFTRGAIADGLERASRHFGLDPMPLQLEDADAVASWAADHDVSQIITAEAPVGPSAERLRTVAARLGRAGIPIVRLRRDWDDALWPLATAGFFPFREKLPRIWDTLRIDVINPELRDAGTKSTDSPRGFS